MQQLLLKYVKYGILLYYFINFTYLSYFTLPRLFYPTKLQTPALPLLVIKISRCLYFYVEPSYTPPLSLVYIIGGPQVNRDLEGPCKQTQHVGTTSPNIVGMVWLMLASGRSNNHNMLGNVVCTMIPQGSLSQFNISLCLNGRQPDRIFKLLNGRQSNFVQ